MSEKNSGNKNPRTLIKFKMLKLLKRVIYNATKDCFYISTFLQQQHVLFFKLLVNETICLHPVETRRIVKPNESI